MNRKLGTKSQYRIYMAVLVLLACFISGCMQQPSENPGGTLGGSVKGPGGCSSAESCSIYCQQHTSECEHFCMNDPAACPAVMGGIGNAQPDVDEMGAGTACSDVDIKQKIGDVISTAMVNPPSQVRGINWMTKVLPAGNPFPGYYYVIGTAFGPGVDETRWSGEGEPQYTSGEFYCTFGYWDSTPKGNGALFGDETPETFNADRYDLTIFCTNSSGKSQAAMTSSLPALTMTEDQARQYFYTVIKKSFLNIDGKPMSRVGNMYQLMWKDSSASHDQWEVQIGTGYINIGQGEKNYKETEYVASMRGKDPGTLWLYHGCRPCINCGKWTEDSALNKDCTQNSDCLGGLSCNSGYCVDPTTLKGAAASSNQTVGAGTTSLQGTGGSGSTGAPGSVCSSNTDCASGLSCKMGICTVPSGPS